MAKKYRADYLPYSDAEGWVSPSREGFNTEQEAYEYVKTQLCDTCKAEAEEKDQICWAEWHINEYNG